MSGQYLLFKVTNNIKISGKYLERGTGLKIDVPEDRLPLEIRRKMGIALRLIKGDDVKLFKGKVVIFPFAGMKPAPEPKPTLMETPIKEKTDSKTKKKEK